MVARFLYRLVSLVLFLGGIACWLIGAGAIVVQVQAQGFDLTAFFVSIWAFVMALMAMQCSTEAWQAARRHRHDPLWWDYP
jgi:hypothetical protein